MRIVAFSDTHGLHEQLTLPRGDVAIFAGDACMYGSRREMWPFLDWYADQPHRTKIMIAGNHDKCAEKYPDFMQEQCRPRNIVYLQDDYHVLDGDIVVYGTPWTPQFGPWAFMAEEAVLAGHFRKIFDFTDILVTHGPRRAWHDMNQYGEHCGSEALAEAMEARSNLSLHICGHIHEMGGRSLMNMRQLIMVNASVTDEHYDLANKPVIIDRIPVVKWEVL